MAITVWSAIVLILSSHVAGAGENGGMSLTEFRSAATAICQSGKYKSKTSLGSAPVREVFVYALQATRLKYDALGKLQPPRQISALVRRVDLLDQKDLGILTHLTTEATSGIIGYGAVLVGFVKQTAIDGETEAHIWRQLKVPACAA